MRMKVLPLAALTALLSVPQVALASGSYPGQAVRPPSIDAEKYAVGKQIFTGRMRLPETAQDPGAQIPRLRSLQEAMAKQGQKADLLSLAGKLTGEQLDALAYYLQIRYGVAAPPEEPDAA